MCDQIDLVFMKGVWKLCASLDKRRCLAVGVYSRKLSEVDES